MRHRLALLAALLAAALAAPASGAAAQAPHLDHIFVVVLENENASTSFGPRSPAPYLARTLPRHGALVPNYYGIGHASLDNYIAMVSGQAPNIETQADCQLYTDFLPGLAVPGGQYLGQGCVYPSGVETVANQLEDSGFTWKGYMQDMAHPCLHPALNSRDQTQSATRHSQYAARHDPFVYFHEITDFPTCRQNVVPLPRLRTALASRASTPNFSFITPDLCNDGHDSPCVNGHPGGLVQANRFLRRWVPRIVGSPGFRDHGLLLVTFDEAGDDSSACCGERAGWNTPTPGGESPGPGGGRVGAVALSPCIKPGTRVTKAFNHYSLLRSVEENFGLPLLGYARQPSVHPFGDDVLNAPACHQRP